MRKFFYILNVLFLAVCLVSCGKDDDNPVDPPPPPGEDPPSFNMTAQPVALDTGDEGLAFYACCVSNDVNMVKVVVKNPRGQSETYNAGNVLVLKDEEFECQPPGMGYFKYLGTWTLTFTGNKATDTHSSFTVVKSLNVTGKIK